MPTEADLLADLLDGKIDAADVPAEIAELASLAESVSRHITLIPPTDAFRAALRDEVVQATSAGGGGAGGGSGPGGAGGTGGAAGTATTAATATGGGLSGIVAGIAATAVLATSTVAAADRAGPGDLLAGLDRGIESLQLVIADQEREAELLVDYAAERVLETLDVVDAEVVADLLRQSQELLDQALELGVQQGRDLQELLEPYQAALLTLASRTDDPAVLAQVTQLLEDAGLDSTTLLPGTDDLESPSGDPGGGGQLPTDSGNAQDDDTDGDGDGGEGGVLDEPLDDLTDPLEDPTDPLDDLDDPLDDPTEPLDDLVDPLEDPTGPLDDVGDTLDDATGQVGDTADELGGATGGVLGN